MKLKPAITETYAEDTTLPIISGSEWKIIEAVVAVLKPFYDYTIKLQSRQASIGFVLPIYYILCNAMVKEARDESSLVRDLKRTICNGMNKRMSEYIRENFLIIPTILDPRFKLNFFPNFQRLSYSFTGKDEAKALVNQYLSAEIMEKQSTTPLAADLNKTSVALESNNDETDIIKIFQESHPMLDSDNLLIPPLSLKQNFEKELHDYLLLPVIDFKNGCPYKWWFENQGKFPLLVPIFKKYTSAPVSSAESERTFSNVGMTITDLRQRLLPETVQKMTFLSKNILLFD